MNRITNERGFQLIRHQMYTDEQVQLRVVGQSSAIGDYEDSLDKPGSSFLWVGGELHLGRKEVAELAGYLKNWLETGELFPREE